MSEAKRIVVYQELPEDLADVYRRLEQQRAIWMHGSPLRQAEARVKLDELLDEFNVITKLGAEAVAQEVTT